MSLLSLLSTPSLPFELCQNAVIVVVVVVVAGIFLAVVIHAESWESFRRRTDGPDLPLHSLLKL